MKDSIFILLLVGFTSCSIVEQKSKSSGYANIDTANTLWLDQDNIPVCFEKFAKPEFLTTFIQSDEGRSVWVKGQAADSIDFKLISAEESCTWVDNWNSLDLSEPEIFIPDSSNTILCLRAENADEKGSITIDLSQQAFIPRPDELKKTASFRPTLENKRIIADFLREEFLRAGFGFTGFANCEDSSRGVRIEVNYMGRQDQTLALGRGLDGLKNGVQLNWGKSCGKEIPSDVCMKNTALHEFGHVLGLRHEMNRPDNETCEKDQTKGQGENGALQIGLFNQDSMMSYCRERGNLFLSEGDIKTLNAYYRGPIAHPTALEGPTQAAQKSFYVKPSVAAFRYLITEQIRDCVDEKKYSPEEKAGRLFPVDLQSFSPTKNVYLCVLGKSQEGDWQDTQSFSAVPLRIKTKY